MIELIAENGDCMRFTTKKWNNYNLFLIQKFVKYISYLLIKENKNAQYYNNLEYLRNSLQYYDSVLKNQENVPLIIYNKIINLISRYNTILQYYEIHGLINILTRTFYEYNDINYIIEFYKRACVTINQYKDNPKMYKLHIDIFEFLTECKNNRFNIEVVII